MSDRLSSFEAIDNFRNCGGYAVDERKLTAMTGRVASPDAVVAFLVLEKAYPNEAFISVAAHKGAVSAYFTRTLGLVDAMRDRFRARLAS